MEDVLAEDCDLCTYIIIPTSFGTSYQAKNSLFMSCTLCVYGPYLLTFPDH